MEFLGGVVLLLFLFGVSYPYNNNSLIFFLPILLPLPVISLLSCLICLLDPIFPRLCVLGRRDRVVCRDFNIGRVGRVVRPSNRLFLLEESRVCELPLIGDGGWF
ncbi:hypothetical protein DM860_003529 [Cuscuta australis]|uniref:Uncharacterized protein n=1 Tax=Cuscuta australis TaxID=267555 RepID=A0A328DHV5_9ASTE|nr:hypothetical protein DM860_003529 [Cuscuta australis]